MTRISILTRGVVVGTALLLALLVGVAPAASAAGGVSVDVTPGTSDVEAGETTTFDVVVNSTDVGAVNLTVSLTDGSVATIESVDTPAGDSQEDISNDGQTATVAAYGLQDAGQAGSTAVATVTVAGASAGSTSILLDDVGVFDAQGNAYDTTVGDATLTVDEQNSNGGGSSNDSDDEVSTSTPDGDTDVTSTPDGGTDVTSTSPATDGGDTTDEESSDETTTSSVPTTVSTSSATTDSENQSTVTQTRTPGFTLVLGVLALLGTGLVAARRQ